MTETSSSASDGVAPAPDSESGAPGARPRRPRNLEALLDVLVDLSQGDGKIAVADVHDEIGVRSFGPALLAVGLLLLTPLGAVPLVPTTGAVIVMLNAGQLLIGRRRFWIPNVVRKRAVGKERFRRMVEMARRPARVIDRMIGPRLVILTLRPVVYVVAAVCVLTAIMTPPLELVPFAGFVPAFAFATFGLALTAHDGVVALIAFAFAGGTLYLVLSQVVLN